MQEMQETKVPSLCQEDPLEKQMSMHSNILARKIPWTEEPDKLQSMGSQSIVHDWATNSFTFLLPTLSPHPICIRLSNDSAASTTSHLQTLVHILLFDVNTFSVFPSASF